MRKIICIGIAAIGLGIIEAGSAEAQDRCKPGWVYNGRSCVIRTTKQTDRAVTNPEPEGYGYYRRNPGNPCGDPHLTIQEGACRGP